MLGQERCSSPFKTTEFGCLGPNISRENTYIHIQVTYWLCRLYFGMYTCNDNENRGHEFEGEQRDMYEIGERKGGNCIIIFHNINKKK